MIYPSNFSISHQRPNQGIEQEILRGLQFEDVEGITR